MSPKPRTQKRGAGRHADFPLRLDVYPLTGGGMLFGGEAGHKVYRAIYERLRQTPRGGVLLVDLSRVRQASHKALKEVLSVVEVLRTSKFEERYVVFRMETRDRDLVESIEVVAKHGGGIIPVVDERGVRHNFGKLTKAERDTLGAVERRGEMTSKELRELLGLLPSAASNRLRRLHHLRLIRRDERVVPESGGREFVYRPLFEGRVRASRARRD